MRAQEEVRKKRKVVTTTSTSIHDVEQEGEIERERFGNVCEEMFVYIENIIMGEHCEHGTGKKNKTQDTESDMKISFRCFFDRTRCVREIRMADWEKDHFLCFYFINRLRQIKWKIDKKVKNLAQNLD